MVAGPAVIVNGLDDAVAALRAARGAPVTLLSAPGAALFAGCLWWREVVRQAREAVPVGDVRDVLDCADAGGLAVSALRIGQRAIVLHRGCAGSRGGGRDRGGLRRDGARGRAPGARSGGRAARRGNWKRGCTVTRPGPWASTQTPTG